MDSMTYDGEKRRKFGGKEKTLHFRVNTWFVGSVTQVNYPRTITHFFFLSDTWTDDRFLPVTEEISDIVPWASCF